MFKNVIIKIEIVGNFMDDYFYLLMKNVGSVLLFVNK